MDELNYYQIDEDNWGFGTGEIPEGATPRTQSEHDAWWLKIKSTPVEPPEE